MNARDRRNRAAEEAAEWVLRLQSEDMSRSERLQYVQWLRESPLHVGEMLRLSRVHAQLAEFPGWKSMRPADVRGFGESLIELDAPPGRESADRSIKQSHRRSWVLGAVPAAFAALVLIVMYFVYDASQTIATGAAERREVGLPDGTLVRLSPQTTLQVRYTRHARGVLLSRGDALFRVAKDPTKPFFVQTDHTRVRAVGTAFGVEHDGDSVIITVEDDGRLYLVEQFAIR